MTRLLLLTVLAAVLTGCSTTALVVPTSDPAAVFSANQSLRGRRATISLDTGEQAVGRIAYVRIDSTAWQEDGLRRAVLTPSVTSIQYSNARRSVRDGLLIGAGVGVAFAVAVVASPGPEDSGDEIADAIANGFLAGARGLAIVALPIGGAGYGFLGGALASRRTEYTFVNAPPAGTSAVAEPAAVSAPPAATAAPAATEAPAGGGE